MLAIALSAAAAMPLLAAAFQRPCADRPRDDRGGLRLRRRHAGRHGPRLGHAGERRQRQHDLRGGARDVYCRQLFRQPAPWLVDRNREPARPDDAGAARPGRGLAATLAGLVAVAAVVVARSASGRRLPPPRLLLAAAMLAALSTANLVVAGQPWGVVYGLGLWDAKLASAAGADLASNAYRASPGNMEQLHASVLLDVTSPTNIGLIVGAFLVMLWRRFVAPQVTRLSAVSWLCVALADWSSATARGSPSAATSAFFSGISTGSLHGWAWFAAAFLGSSVGVRLSSFVFRAASSAPRAGVTNCPGEPSRLLIAGAVIVSVAIPTLADLVARPIDPYELQHQRRSAQALRRLAVIARRPDRLGERALVSLAASLPDGASASYGSPAARSHFRYEFPSGARIAVTRLCDGPIRNKSGRLSEIDSTAT